MFFRQIYEEGLAQASYVVGSPEAQAALVVDPRRDIDVYLDIARENELKIVGVTETHIHADFLSGARELAAATGAVLHLSGEGGPDWRYRVESGFNLRVVKDGDVISIGDVAVRVAHVPGHTPEHLMFIVSEAASAPGPMIAMTGDFVFVGDIGRPDLLEAAVGVAGSAQAGARAMFASLRDKFAAVPDFVQIWPAHGAGSACGKALGAVPASTAGYERLTAWWAPYLQKGDVDGFTRELLDGQPDAPTYFARMKRLNRDGMRILGGLPVAAKLDIAGARIALSGNAMLIDTRDPAAYKAGHMTGALSIPDAPTFSTRAGWFAPPDVPIVLIARPERVDALVRALIRVGLDNIAGYIPADDPAPMGLELAPLESIDVAGARARVSTGEAVLLDVRTSLEYRHRHAPGALHVPAGQLLGRLDQVPRDRPLLVHCAGGSRSVCAASVLLARGYEHVVDVAGGFDAWEEAGNPVETSAPSAHEVAVGRP